ncbi:MAG TPA: ROK family protein [Anaerolineales bacterium]|jgi:polyphosphate glucokinase|nr:ROK family protein [Anaerolineales bacterium]
MEILGIDIGGSGIKGAPVDTETGALLAPRYRIRTPRPAKPRPVAKTVAEIAKHFDWQGPIGCGFPAVVQRGVTLTAANVHDKWIGEDAEALLTEQTGCPVRMINDADAAGLAEMAFGAGQGRLGTVVIITIGTGLGTALFTNGQLVPNTEFGHIEIKGKDAEKRASDATRKRKNLSWKKWSKRLDEYLRTMESLVWPDLIILGGGVSKKHEKFIPRLSVQAEVVPAQLLNEAGIVGAALAAQSPVREEN